jgi:hypothetical protein
MTSNQPWWLTWPPAEVAATILPLFSHSSNVQEMRAITAIVSWSKTGSYVLPNMWGGKDDREAQFDDPHNRSIAEGVQVLEHAGLLMRSFSSDHGSFVGLTRLGMHALQTNAVRQHLGLSDTPPTGPN